MVYTHVLLYLHCSLISDSGRQRGRHSCSAAGKEQSLVVVQQMSCANRVESALLCSRLLLLLLVLSFAIGLRITRLNGSYLATEDCYGYPQKPIEWNGLKIELIGAEIVDGEAFLQEYNIDRESIFSDSLSEKYALFHISVTKVSDSPLLTYYRFDYCGAEKDGWRNLVSPEIFESLNPLAKKPSQLSVGETEELAMAIGLHKDAFRNTEWSNLSTSDISLVMSVYPQKVILQSS